MPAPAAPLSPELARLIEGLARDAARLRAALPVVARLRPVRQALWLSEAEGWIKQGDWPRARATLDAAVLAEPDDAAILNHAGYSALERREGLEVAIARIEKAAAAAPDNNSIRDSLGWAHVVAGQPAKGVALLERASRTDPANAVIAEHLGDALWLTGRRIEAQQAWERARWAADVDADRARIAQKLAQGYRPDTMAP